MIVNLKRCLSIFLVMMLLIGIIPAAYAVESGADSTQPEKTVSEGTESTDSIDPTEPTEPTEPPDIANPQDDYAVMSVGSTQKSIMLFDYADNGNYTTVLKSQVSCEYKPNGTGAARTAYIKNLGWHFARYGGVPIPMRFIRMKADSTRWTWKPRRAASVHVISTGKTANWRPPSTTRKFR